MQTELQANQDIAREETIPVQAVQPVKRTIYQSLWQKWQRFIGFGCVGGAVAVAGMILIYLLVHYLHVNVNLAYAIQSIFSIETNFILNRFLNWRDRRGNIASQWAKFNFSKIGTVSFNQALFSLLVHVGVFYVLATVINIAISTFLNYVTNNIFVFVTQSIEEQKTLKLKVVTQSPNPPVDKKYLPHVGIVIPFRNSKRTIRQCFSSALTQDYRGKISIFLVGNMFDQDNTWEALGDLSLHTNVHTIQIPRPQGWSGRDANLKRYQGCQVAFQCGVEVIAFLDSQVYAPETWLSHAVALLDVQRVDGIAGISRHHPDDKTLSSIYQDGSLFSEWPRYGHGMVLTEETFHKGKGLPITANLLLTRRAFQRLGNDFPIFYTSGWDDFELAWRLMRTGCTLYCTNQVRVYRNHIRKFRLVKQFSSGISGMIFFRDNPGCGYTRLRVTQVVGVLLAPPATIVLMLNLLMLHAFLLLVGLILTFYLTYSILSIWKARDWRGVLFLFIDILHITLWVAGAIYAFFCKGQVNPTMADLLVKLR